MTENTGMLSVESLGNMALRRDRDRSGCILRPLWTLPGQALRRGFLPQAYDDALEPPPVFNGDMYQAEGLTHVPRNLHEASSLFERSAFARSVLGAEVVEHYLHFFQTEEAAFPRSVTDWERKRYFERI
jgi:Glutamine synthetase, catalytic domain